MNTIEKIDGLMKSLDSLGIPAADLIVCRDHDIIYRNYVGFSDDAKTKPLCGKELYFFFSATKMFTCCAALQLIEKGKLALTDRVDQYLPSYKGIMVQTGSITRPAVRPMTIRHLMSMQSGMNYELNAPILQETIQKYGRGTTTQQLVNAMAAIPLGFDPGADYCYSLSHDVLAAVIEVVSGMPFGNYLKKYIMEPCGINDISFNSDKERLNRMCSLYKHECRDGKPIAVLTDLNNPYKLSEAYESGGAGLNGSVDEYIRLLDALACDGMATTGNRILKPETVHLWSTEKLDGKARETFNGNRGCLGYTYGLGVRIMEHCNGSKALSPDGEFGWDGAAGAYSLVDRLHHLSIFFAMHVLNYNKVYLELHPLLRDLLYETLV